jgi:hypothetical protein
MGFCGRLPIFRPTFLFSEALGSFALDNELCAKLGAIPSGRDSLALRVGLIFGFRVYESLVAKLADGNKLLCSFWVFLLVEGASLLAPKLEDGPIILGKGPGFGGVA